MACLFFCVVHEVITGFMLQRVVARVLSGAWSNDADKKLQTDACSCDGYLNLLLSLVTTSSALLFRLCSAAVGLLGTSQSLPHMGIKRGPFSMLKECSGWLILMWRFCIFLHVNLHRCPCILYKVTPTRWNCTVWRYRLKCELVLYLYPSFSAKRIFGLQPEATCRWHGQQGMVLRVP